MSSDGNSLLNLRPVVPEHVLFQEVVGNSALLNLETETYFGLDDVGTRMWQELSQAETVGAAARSLAEIYEAPLETIERDIAALAAQLQGHGLLELEG
ncbi:MAG: PqqD family protein [Sphingomonas sp.]